MSGIFGVLTTNAGGDAAGVARRLAANLPRNPWERAEWLEAEPARVCLGFMWDAEKSAGPAEGLCRAGDLACSVLGPIARVTDQCDAELLLERNEFASAACTAYREFGTGFAARLEGPYSLLLWDAARRTLLVASGRDGLAPLYVWHGPAGWLFCSAVGPLARSGLFTPGVDPASAGCFLSYGQLFGRSTLLDGVEAFDAATVLEIPLSSAEARKNRYWDFGRIGARRHDLSLARHVTEVCDVLESAATRLGRRSGRHVSGLSGGLDSRLVTGLAARKLKGLRAWTFGDSGSADMQIARQVCERLGLEHLAFPIDAAAVAEEAEQFAAMTDGCLSVNFAFSLVRCRQLRQSADVALSGFAGDAILGGSILGPKQSHVAAWLRYKLGRGARVANPRLEGNRSDEDIALYVQAIYGKRGRVAPHVAVAPPSLAEIARGDLAGPLAEVPLEFRAEQWIHENRPRRWTVMGVVADRHFLRDGSLFYDYEVRDRCLALPPALRRGQRAYIKVLQALLPEVANLTYGNTGLPATTPPWRVTAVTARRLRAALRRRARRYVPTTGTDVNGWSRTVLREFYDDLLHDPSTRGRSFWDADGILREWEAHLCGEVDFGAELGLIAAVELFARRWVDGSDPSAAR